jgi:hypothetical protein
MAFHQDRREITTHDFTVLQSWYITETKERIICPLRRGIIMHDFKTLTS